MFPIFLATYKEMRVVSRVLHTTVTQYSLIVPSYR